jgi:hypothetical protein
MAMQIAGGNIPFQDKVDLALTTAVITNHGSFTLNSKEEKLWRLVNVNDKSQFQVRVQPKRKIL